MLTDVVMPAVSGPNLVAQVVALRPQVRSLFMSGYPADVVAQRGLLEDDAHFLHKPFTSEALAAKLRQALAGSGSA